MYFATESFPLNINPALDGCGWFHVALKISEVAQIFRKYIRKQESAHGYITQLQQLPL